ncbi:MAG: DJ-1/PfpI family protein [Candidatus Woesearchaeota archaeon]
MVKSVNVLMIVAQENFRDEEYEIPHDYFKNNGFQIDTASIKSGLCIGKFGLRIIANKSLEDINTSDYDAIVYIGGPGTPVLRANTHSIRIAKDAFDKNKLLAAICWAPTILAKAGILKNRKATVWQGNDSEFKMLTSEYLEKMGAYYTGENVTKDVNIITADGPESAREFSEMIVSLLC